MLAIIEHWRRSHLTEETMARFYTIIPWDDVHMVTAYRHPKTGCVRLRFTHTLAYAEVSERDAGFSQLLKKLSQELLPNFSVFDAVPFSERCQNIGPFETVLWRRSNHERANQNER